MKKQTDIDIRDELLAAIKEEIVGPAKSPKYKDEETGKEVLLRKRHGSPKSKYGAGMLYPQNTINKEEGDTESQQFEEEPEKRDDINDKQHQPNKEGKAKKEDLDYEEPVGLANQFLPSAMGFTVRFNSEVEDDQIELSVNTASYEKAEGKKPVKQVNKDNKIESAVWKDDIVESDYWIRRPHAETVSLRLNSIFNDNSRSEKITILKTDTEEWLSLSIYDRTTSEDKKDGLKIYTFTLVNEYEGTTDNSANDKHILYQNKLTLKTVNEELIVPYKERTRSSDTEEEKELNLLYRKKRVFSIGHGVSVNWNSHLDENSQKEKVNKVYTSIIPSYEMPQIAPTAHVDLSMLELSDMGDWDEAQESLKTLAESYERWIDQIEVEAKNELSDSYKEAATNAVKKCRVTLQRIKNGIQALSEADKDSMIVKSFRWMNRAMLWQQQRSNTPQRIWKRTRRNGEVYDILSTIDDSGREKFKSLKEFHDETDYWGSWRPFQIAFVLMNIESITDPDSEEREIVDLIWFPTGGGKTEAYLGLSAFTIFYRRLKGDEKFEDEKYAGTTILMRYTLRLLTTQQYERAASLICACDLIKEENIELGEKPISIGLWVGGTSTPNDNQKARNQYKDLNKSLKYRYKWAPYNFVVMKCPCCAAQIGKVKNASKSDSSKVKGIHKEDGKKGRIIFKCENEHCEYHSKVLPLHVVDEQIYENPPTLLLGTVDKFAMIPWKKQAGRLFGFRKENDNKYRIKPPELIIQDELHLISGPLGSMVGMYETMIQTLCNDYELYKPPFIEKDKSFVSPKIVASSATISRAKEQVQGLYGTNKLHIFPSQGLEFGETWFSEQKSVDETDDDGNKRYPGRLYTGILASGYPSAQTSIVRAYSSILQKVKEKEEYNNIDYYWTLLGYFNSIRELGGAMSLVHGDIRERLQQIQKRDLVGTNERRKLYDWKIQELTSRISSDQIPDTLKKLEKKYDKNKGTKSNALDICLATNMVATGVDISRLGLMFIHGQPKTTAEYIQASSRAGRKVPEGPGFIFTLYSPSKPRDKSQYEQFQGYHSRIYSNVEPTSVTPFSVNVRERALHAIIIGLIRHFSHSSLYKDPILNNTDFNFLKKIITDIILERCTRINPSELEKTKALIEQRLHFWEKMGFQHYGDAGNYKIRKTEGYFPLMYSNSSEVRNDVIGSSLATPTSMRGVDTESKIKPYSIS